MPRLICPRCSTTFSVPEGAIPICPNCRYTTGTPPPGTPTIPVVPPPAVAPPGSYGGPAYAPPGVSGAATYTPPPPPGYAPGVPYGVPPPSPLKKTNGFAVAALVCGILGLCTPIIVALLALIFGIVAKNQIRQRQEAGDGMAIAGIILGSIALVLQLLYFFLVFALVGGNLRDFVILPGLP